MSYGIKYLRNKLETKRSRNLMRYDVYEQKDRLIESGIVIPPAVSNRYMSVLGWCTKAVDSLADRLVFRGFDDANDLFDLNAIYNVNNADILFDSAIRGSLISSCSFIFISADDDGYPTMQVIDGANATGIIDDRTYLLKEGYAVLERDKNNLATKEAYLEPFRTTYFEKGKEPVVYDHSCAWALLVPVIYRPDTNHGRYFGHSRISRACMDLQKAAKRTLMRSEVSAEFYSFPQKYVLGTDPDSDQMDKWRATVSSFLQFDRDEDGNSPTLGQFSQLSMQPFTDQLRSLAAMFAGETGLTLDDLGFVTDNPSSAEAIKASHENLRLIARKAQRSYAVAFLNAGYLAACLRDNQPYLRSQLYQTEALWEPIFEPDAAMLSGIGDGAIKINQAVPGYFGKSNLRNLTGIESES